MKILITGNLGYVGSELVKTLRRAYPTAELIGFDSGFFMKQVTNALTSPEIYLDQQVLGDVRDFPEALLKGVDTVIQLAAISNDPIGNKFEKVTFEVNHRAVSDIAVKAKNQGVKNVVFASSCSVYGFAEEEARTESSTVNPLTAYAKSKVGAEKDLEALADDGFKVTSLRFATACGMSDRLRLDLVLNDFLAGAISSEEITILSDGTPWRPLINVRDMGTAIIWGFERDPGEGGNYLVVNTGSDSWNYQIKELAYAIQEVLPEVKVSVNKDALPDKRSYRVNFDLYKKLAPGYQPEHDLIRTIQDLVSGLQGIGFNDRKFRESKLIRLVVVNEMLSTGILDESLHVVR